ncbi:hypothetical protein GTY47_15295 [Streptomyces sp. SID5464]|nr:hypothetical protein [Streptomyces sp. SID5464]
MSPGPYEDVPWSSGLSWTPVRPSRAPATCVPPFPDVPSGRCPGFGWVNQATAAPVSATGHSTTPATPSTPAPA